MRAADDIPQFAVDHSSTGTRGNLYAVWQDARFSSQGHDEIAFSRSTDGGNTWSTPKRVSTPTGKPAFTPAVAVASDGTIAVAYYDFRNDDSAAPLATDLWTTTSHDGGQSWTEQHVSGPFDMTQAPNAGGYFLGDYLGLTAAGTTFHPVWAQPDALQSTTDIYTTTVTP